MIIFLKTGGEVAYVSDENINLGSDKANSIFVVAPYAPASSVCVAFKLPNGKTLGPGFVENQGVVTFDSEDGNYTMQKVTFEGDSGVIPGYTFEGQKLSAWSYDIQSVLTGVSGTLGIQLFIFADGRCISTDLINTTVNVGVNNLVEPSIDPTGDVYEQILNYLSETNTYMTGIKQEAAASANEARAWANGTYVDEEGDSQPVAEGTEQYQNNAKYYAEHAAESAASAKNYAEVIAPQEAEEAATEAANNVLNTVNNRLDTLETEMDSAEDRLDNAEDRLDNAEDRLDNAEDRLDNAEDRLDNVDYILEQFGAVKAQVDSSAALVKSIPARSDLFAYLNSVGGKTEAYRQLLNLPEGAETGYYFWQLAEGSSFGQQLNKKITTVKSGVTIVNNGDGTFTINGTAEKYGTFALFSIYLLSSEDYAENYAFSIPVPNGNHYLSFGGASLPAGANVYVGTDFGTDEGGSGGEVSATGGALSINQGWHICVMDLNFEAGTVFDSLTIKPMLNLGTSALPWQSPADPFTGLRSGKVTALKVYGANLLNVKNIKNNLGTVTLIDDDSFRVDGFNVRYIIPSPKAGTYYLSYGSTRTGSYGGGVVIGTYDSKGSLINSDAWYPDKLNGSYSQVCDGTEHELRILFYGSSSSGGSSATYTDVMLSFNAAVPYTRYHEPIIHSIPEAVQALDLYGEGVTDSSTKITYANTVDFENNQYKKYLPEKLVFDGVNVKATSVDVTGVYRALFTLPNATPSARALNITHFVVNYVNTAGSAYLVGKNLIMCPSDQSLNTLDKFNAWLKEMYDAGTPVEAVYAVATPEITDISVALGDFDPVIPVEGGGQIEFENKYKYDVPSTVTYNIIQEA